MSRVKTGSVTLRWLERALLIVGAASIAWCTLTWFHALAYQREHAPVLQGARSAQGPPPAAVAPAPRGWPIAVLNIPRLGVSTVVAEGDDAGTLKVGIGHVPDTPMPWQDGNSALAAHRDTFFRPLKDIRVGDELYLSRPGQSDLHYLVRETVVVWPEDLWVLDPTRVPTLTLITCYPFYFVGAAPQRFVVRAERVLPAAGTRPQPSVGTVGKQVAGAVSN